MELAGEVYRVARLLPPDERFELGTQLRTAVASVSANIAEGKGRSTALEFARFLAIARGSARETASHLELAVHLGFVPPPDAQKALRLTDEVIRMLTVLMRKLAPRTPSRSPET